VRYREATEFVLIPSPLAGEGKGKGVPVSQELKNRARKLRSNQTDVEANLWRRLRDRKVFGAKLRRQHPIGPYIVDFFCPTLGLIIDLYGGQHADQSGADQARTCFLESRGYRVLRFWNNQVILQLDEVLEQIAKWCVDPHPPLKRARVKTGR
jgi:very-short-patch-repair endonuclease